MKFLAAFLLTTSLLTISSVGDVAERAVQAGSVTIGEIVVMAREPSPEPVPTEPKRTITPHNLVVSTPGDCLEGQESYDLLVHFHGNPLVVEREWHHAGIRSVLATINLGANTKAYTQAYHYENALPYLVKLVHRYVRRQCPNLDQANVDRLAISAWSGGYAAVQRLLRREELAGRIDAVLLSDGLHASLLYRWPRKMSTLGLEPFVAFAERATQREKLFAITHTGIPTERYASTTETSDHLLAELDLSRTPATRPVDETLTPESLTEAGNFSVHGFEGQTAKDHAAQLKTLGKTLFPRLARWWRRGTSRHVSAELRRH